VCASRNRQAIFGSCEVGTHQAHFDRTLRVPLPKCPPVLQVRLSVGTPDERMAWFCWQILRDVCRHAFDVHHPRASLVLVGSKSRFQRGYPEYISPNTVMESTNTFPAPAGSGAGGDILSFDNSPSSIAGDITTSTLTSAIDPTTNGHTRGEGDIALFARFVQRVPVSYPRLSVAGSSQTHSRTVLRNCGKTRRRGDPCTSIPNSFGAGGINMALPQVHYCLSRRNFSIS